MNLKNISPDHTWTLFLDRDGVINKRPPDDYVKQWDEFEFLPGVTEAIASLTHIFGRIIVVTNQQGIGKGIMSSTDLELIHRRMLEEIKKSGGRIDAVYHCPDLASTSNNCRKPGTLMARQAKKDFKEIDFSKSIMVGDTLSDMVFGKNAGMMTVMISTDSNLTDDKNVDHACASLETFARSIIGTV